MSDAAKARVIACDIFKPELDAVLHAMRDGGARRYIGREVEVTYLSSLLHSDFDKLAAAVGAAVRAYGGPFMLLYGAKCHPNWDGVLSGCGAVRFRESNCVHLISGQAAEPGASRDFYLTAGWIRGWPGFRGDDAALGITPEKCREMFAHHCDRAVFFDTGVCAPLPEETAFFEKTTGLLIERKPVGIEIFAGKFLDALKRLG